MKKSVLVRYLFCAVALVPAGITVIAGPALVAQTSGQKTFTSSKEAIEAFAAAVKAGDTTTLQAILGEGSGPIVSSGDDVADKAARDRFVQRYSEGHSLASAGHHQYTLDVGSDDWPLPIPLVDNSGTWYFDGAAGKEEILYRRIGHNEEDAINVCKGVVAAQRDYAAQPHDGIAAGAYAQRIVSTAGKQDGIYWEAKAGEPESPAGPMLASASGQGYDVSGKSTPYHGYYYRMVKNPAGYAFLAYPAEYRTSGVMTFVVTQKGVVRQKDLGEQTSEVVQHIEQYKLDSTWKPVK
jgi:hypothetical protein